MIVTDLKYGLEKRLVKKLDLMIQRCTQPRPIRDAPLICEGGEGEGKTNSSVAIAYYVKCKTGRDAHLFFRLEPLIKFAQSTEEKIIIWDEPALDSLGMDWYKEVSKNLLRLLMTARKKRHFIIFNFTKFYKFSEYIVVDRCLGLIHMYSRNEITPGRFVYIRRRDLEALYLGYKISKKRLYNKLKSFRGSFPDIMEKYFDKMDFFVEGKPHATFKDYQEEKDKAIFSIGKSTKMSEADEERILKGRVGRLKLPIQNREELAKQLKIHPRTLYKWSGKDEKDGFLEDVSLLPSAESPYTINKGLNGMVKDAN